MLRNIISLGRCWNFKRGSNDGNPTCCAKKLKADDEINLAGLWAFVLEEVEKHLILNSNRLRTFEHARLKIVTYVEAKFGLTIRDSKPGDTGSRGHSDPMDVDAVNSLLSGKGKGSSSPRDVCFKCGGAHFQRDCNARKGKASNHLARANRASHGPRLRAKERVKKVIGNPDENPKVPKVRTRVKPRKLVYQVLKTRNQRQAQKTRNLHRRSPLTILTRTLLGVMIAGVTLNGMITELQLEWHEGWDQTCDNSASPFSLEVLILVP